MARHSRLHAYKVLADQGLVPIFYHADSNVVLKCAEACSNGGAHLFEFTNRGEGAFQTFMELERFARESAPDLVLGAGSIVDPETAALYINIGASFIVGPSFNFEIAKLCNRRKVGYIPGCGSVTEISNAEESGCEVVKLFPAGEVGGPAFIKALKGPMPWTSILATGGVELDEANIKSWFNAGATAVGMGSIFKLDEITSGDFKGLTNRVTTALSYIRAARSSK